jgi:acetolactate synthase-1/2/3 large subunit
MALGYALASDKPGVYSVVPGPGLLNTTAALATGYARNAKLLCLTGQIRSDQIGRGFGMLHELPDQFAILAALTKWAARIESPGEAPALVAAAFQQLAGGRPRPVALETPLDVLAAAAPVDLAAGQPLPVRSPLLDLDAVEAAAQLLGRARHPLIFVGGGATAAGPALLELAEALQAPVVASYNGRGIVDDRHYLSLTYPAGHRLWPQADVVLAVGTRLQAPLMNWGTDEQLQIIRIDIDPAEHLRYGPPAVSLLADACDALTALVPAVARHNRVRPSRRDELTALKESLSAEFAQLTPQIDYLDAIRAELPASGFLVEEMTQVSYVARFAFPVYRPKTFVTTGYQGTLGWGFATALGVKVANPDQPVVSLCGDGGFLFTMQELATAVQQRIATVTLVFNDSAYGNVRRMQVEQYGNRVIATDLHNPDFVRLAEAFGAQGLRAHTPDELRQALRRGFATSDVPTLVEIPAGVMPSPWPFSFLPRNRPATKR